MKRHKKIGRRKFAAADFVHAGDSFDVSPRQHGTPLCWAERGGVALQFSRMLDAVQHGEREPGDAENHVIPLAERKRRDRPDRGRRERQAERKRFEIRRFFDGLWFVHHHGRHPFHRMILMMKKFYKCATFSFSEKRRRRKNPAHKVREQDFLRIVICLQRL